MLLALAVHALANAAQDVTVDTTATLRQALRSAKPGTTVSIAPGDYEGFFVSDVHGGPGTPITVRGADVDKPPRFKGGVQFSKVSHLTITGISIEGATTNGLNIDDGGDLGKPSHHVTLRNVRVRDLPRGNHDGIKLSGVDDFEVADSTVESWGGSGIDMVGCHRGKIVKCVFRKGGDSAVQAKGGSADVDVLRCHFEDFGQRGVNIGGSTGLPYFRPPVTAMPASGRYEAKNVTVAGCTFLRGGASVAFVGVDGARVRFNTIYRPGRWAFRILQETTEPGFLPSRGRVFSDNLVVFRSDEWSAGGVNIGPGTAPETFTFARNFWFCLDSPTSSRPKLPTEETDGQYGLDPLLLSSDGQDLLVREGSPAAKVGAHAFRH